MKYRKIEIQITYDDIEDSSQRDVTFPTITFNNELQFQFEFQKHIFVWGSFFGSVDTEYAAYYLKEENIYDELVATLYKSSFASIYP